jgi:hypothetical protein
MGTSICMDSDQTGEGGSLGTPSGLPEEAPPSAEQEANEAVSGGGMVDPSTEGEPKDTVEKDEDRPSDAG